MRRKCICCTMVHFRGFFLRQIIEIVFKIFNCNYPCNRKSRNRKQNNLFLKGVIIFQFYFVMYVTRLLVEWKSIKRSVEHFKLHFFSVKHLNLCISKRTRLICLADGFFFSLLTKEKQKWVTGVYLIFCFWFAMLKEGVGMSWRGLVGIQIFLS